MSIRSLLFQKTIQLRAIKIALVVGTLLCIINQHEALLAWDTRAIAWVKLGLTYLVPYCVSLYSAISALK